MFWNYTLHINVPLNNKGKCCVISIIMLLNCKSLQQARSRFPTSFFQPGNQVLECVQNTESLAWVSGWKKDAGDLHPVATWRPISCGDLETSILLRYENLDPVVT